MIDFLGLCVSVDAFTLVCISIERYLAICRPLLILKLQSLRSANIFNGLILLLIWTLGLLTTLPNIPMYNLCSLSKRGKFKCELINPKYFDPKYYIIALDGKNIYSNKEILLYFSFSILFFGSNVDYGYTLYTYYM
jgi:hypothetical protein